MRRIQDLSAILLDPAFDLDAVNRACSELYNVFCAAAASAAQATQTTADQRLASGLALSPALAANCLLDGRRTRAFARGALEAIRDATRRHPSAVVEVLYAGTGPFAPLAFLIMPFVDRKRVRFTLLDIHAESARSVSALVRVLGAGDCVREVVCADATTYRHPASLDVVITETMQRSLAEEPFVAIVRNMRPQLAPGGVIVPERVTVELALVDPATEQARWNGGPGRPQRSTSLGKVFEIEAAQEWPEVRNGTTIDVRCDGAAAGQWLALHTRIVTYQVEVLEPYASGLTTADILWSASPVTRDLSLEFRYVDGSRPGVAWCER